MQPQVGSPRALTNILAPPDNKTCSAGRRPTSDPLAVGQAHRAHASSTYEPGASQGQPGRWVWVRRSRVCSSASVYRAAEAHGTRGDSPSGKGSAANTPRTRSRTDPYIRRPRVLQTGDSGKRSGFLRRCQTHAAKVIFRIPSFPTQSRRHVESARRRHERLPPTLSHTAARTKTFVSYPATN